MYDTVTRIIVSIIINKITRDERITLRLLNRFFIFMSILRTGSSGFLRHFSVRKYLKRC